MDEIVKALVLKNELDALRPLDEVQEGRIMQKFRLDWNYHSNHLEGNKLTYGETKALLLFGVTAQGKPLKDTLEMTGHNEAVDWVIDMVKGERPLTENFIRELHTLLLREPYTKKAITADGQETTKRIAVGQYKTAPNHVQTVTGEIFYFATPEETPAKMTELLDWYRGKKEETDTNPVLFAAEFHYRFISIHPFDDGNGRTARLLMNFILMQYGFPPVIIKTDDKENYFAALRLADAGELGGFIAYIATNLNRSLEIMIAGANGENIEDADDLDKEIALLENRLSFISASKETRIKEFTESLFSLVNGFLEIAEKFRKLYDNTSIEIYPVVFALDNQEEIFDYLSGIISDDKIIPDILIRCKFSNFKTLGFKDITFVSELEIYFEENNKYSVF